MTRAARLSPPHPGKKGRAPFLGTFVEGVAAALRKEPGIVAVFPALSRAEDGSGKYVNGLGEYLARETSDLLAEKGVTALSGRELVNDIYATNRGLDSFRDLEDVFLLSERIGASFVVFGSADKVSFDKLKGDEVLKIRWQCRRVADRSMIAFLKKDVTGRDADPLYRYFLVESDWKIGVHARPFVPSPDQEVEFVTRILMRKVVLRFGNRLEGARIAVEPARVGLTRGKAARVRALARAFQESFGKARIRVLKKGGDPSPEAVLLGGPVEIQGRSYPSYGKALEEVGRALETVQGAKAETFGADLARGIAEGLRQAMALLRLKGEVEFLPFHAWDLLERVEWEGLADGTEESPGGLLAERLKKKGVRFLLVSTLRPLVSTYKLRVVFHDLEKGTSFSDSIDFDSRFREALDRRINP